MMMKSWYKKAKNIEDVIQELTPNDKVFMSSSPVFDFHGGFHNKLDYKPRGLWYACGSEWLEFVRNEFSDAFKENLFRIEINPSEVLMIGDELALIKFDKKYSVKLNDAFNTKLIDWGKVSSHYSGIEISPYQWSFRLREDFLWYYGWDVASGCIWDEAAIVNVELIHDDMEMAKEEVSEED